MYTAGGRWAATLRLQQRHGRTDVSSKLQHLTSFPPRPTSSPRPRRPPLAPANPADLSDTHLSTSLINTASMATLDPRMMSVQPRLRYNTIGGINGPLVILDNVRSYTSSSAARQRLTHLVDRSNSPASTRLCLLRCPMAPSALDRSSKLEVSCPHLVQHAEANPSTQVTALSSRYSSTATFAVAHDPNRDAGLRGHIWH